MIRARAFKKQWFNCFVYGLVLLSLNFEVRAQQMRFVTEIMAPFQVEENRKLSGFAVELIEQIKQRTGLAGNIEVYPWTRAYHLAQTKPNVVIFTMVKTPERLQQFNWIGDYFTVTDSFYALGSRKDIVINTIEDAKKYVTCIPRDDVGEQRLTELGFGAKSLMKVSFQSQCLGMLYRNRVDLNLFNEVGIRQLSKKFDVDHQSFRRVFVVSEAIMGMAASKGTNTVLIEQMRQALIETKASEYFNLLIEKWFGQQTTNKPKTTP